MKKITILHISSISDEKSGGVGFVVPNYVLFQGKIAKTALLDIKGAYLGTMYNKYDYEQFKSIKKLPHPFCKPDIVVFHEVYKKEYLSLYKECVSNNIPYVVVPHGCMTKYAQKLKWLKKKLANLILFNNFLKNASAIHYLSDVEKNYSKIDNKSFVCGNGISIPSEEEQLNTKSFIICFMGRYSIYHKGLDILLQSVKKIQEWFRENNIILEMYGMGENKNRDFLIHFVEENKLEDIVHINGPVFGEEKENVLKKTSIFILTSRFEGQPQSIHESLIRGIPCIVSPGTSFASYVEKNKCGFATDGTVESTCKKIKEAYSNRSKLKVYSQNAKKSAKKDFLWQHIAKKNVNIYKELITELEQK